MQVQYHCLLDFCRNLSVVQNRSKLKCKIMAKVHNIAYMVRARIMQQITEKYYQEGCRSCSLWLIWIRHVFPEVGVDYETYLRGLPVDVSELDAMIRKKQLLEWEKHLRKLATAKLHRVQNRKPEHDIIEMEKELV